MSKEKVYWTTKDGRKLDVDEMSVEHLRNTLKMIIRQNQSVPKHSPHNSSQVSDFLGSELDYVRDIEPYAYDYLWKD
jgi:hypothetical protein